MVNKELILESFNGNRIIFTKISNGNNGNTKKCCVADFVSRVSLGISICIILLATMETEYYI